MQRLILICFWIFLVFDIQAQYTSSCIANPELAYRRDWQYIPGFDSSWLNGNLPRERMQPIAPGINLEELPMIHPGQLYTLFLQLDVERVCDTVQYLCVWQSCASRIYLDGKLVSSFDNWSDAPGGIRAAVKK